PAVPLLRSARADRLPPHLRQGAAEGDVRPGGDLLGRGGWRRDPRTVRLETRRAAARAGRAARGGGGLMLTITDTQLDALQDAAEARRKGVSLDRLEELFPEDAVLLGRAGLERVVQFGIARAARHGFDTPRTLHKYIVLM